MFDIFHCALVWVVEDITKRNLVTGGRWYPDYLQLFTIFTILYIYIYLKIKKTKEKKEASRRTCVCVLIEYVHIDWYFELDEESACFVNNILVTEW